MFRGYNRPKKSDIFCPSSIGGTFNDVGRRQIYQEGEGIGSFFSSIFRNTVPFATKAVKKIASSGLARETGKALKESTRGWSPKFETGINIIIKSALYLIF